MALKEEKVSVKASVRKETVAVSATKPKILRKNQNTLPSQPSQPSMTRGRSVSRKRSIRGKGNHGSFLRQPCRFYLKGTCTRSLCEIGVFPNVNSFKTSRDVKRETRVHLCTTRLKNNQVKTPKKGYNFETERATTRVL